MKHVFNQYKLVLLHIAILAGLAYAFAPYVLEGKTIIQSDVVQYKGMASEIKAYYEKEGKGPLWTNSQFGGMPSYQISMVGHDNPIKLLMKPSIHHPVNKLFIAMVCGYIMFLAFGVSRWLALIGAFALAFTTNNLIILEAGHNTKMQAIAYAPLVIAGIKLLLRKRWLLGANLLAIGASLHLASNHIQISYYLLILIAIWMVAELIYSYKNKDLLAYAKAIGIAGIIAIVALAINAGNILLTQEYTKTTIRGKSDLTISKGSVAKKNISSGLDFDYAFQWSNGWQDVLTLFIPNYAGSGSSVDLGDDSVFEGKLPKNAIEEYPFAYWGKLPFTSGPFYFGASIVFLFILGFIFVKGPLRWWILVAFILSIVLSLGKNHFSWFNSFLFEHLPLYNKFRAPSMALTLAQLCVPILAIVGLNTYLSLDKSNKSVEKRLKWTGIGVLGFVLILSLFSGIFTDFGRNIKDDSGRVIKDYDQEVFDQYKINPDLQMQAREDLIRSDGFRSAFFIACTFLLLWFYTKGKIERRYVVFGVLFFVISDLWLVNKRYLNEGNFERKRRVENYVAPSEIDLKIMRDTTHYRVLDLQGNPMSNARTSYFHKSIGGYHAAKLRRYQELFDWQIQEDLQNQKIFESHVLNMLNTKYIIAQSKDNQPFYQKNPNALGNAWFVNEVEFVENADSAILKLSDFNPAKEAIVESRYKPLVTSQNSKDSAARIELTSYHPEKMVYKSTSSSPRVAVFSEIYYPKGWNAYINDKKVEHFCANYVLRGLVIPKGVNKIEFVFEPKTYKIGNTLMLIGNAILYLFILGSLGFWIYSNYKHKN